MSNPRTLTVIASAAKISDDGEQWIEVMPTATKAKNGPWLFTITRDDLDTYAASIASQPGLIHVDYDHEGAEGGSTIAAGWFTGEAVTVSAGDANPLGETQDRDSLWAVVKWTPQAAQEIRDGRFKRISPEFSFVDRDKKSGLMTKAKEIIAATLTNRPFFRELAPIARDGGVVWDPGYGYSALQQELYDALNPGSPDSARYWVMDVAAAGDRALVTEYGADSRTWVVPFTRTDDRVEVAAQSDWTAAEQQWVAAATETATALRKTLPFIPAPGREADSTERNEMSDLKVIATELGLAEDATEEQVIAAVKAAKKLDVPADAVVLTKTERDELVAGAAAGLAANTELQGLKVTTKLKEAVSDGQITVAQKPGYEALAGLDFDKFVETIDALPKGVFATKAKGSGGDVNNDDPDAIADAPPVTIEGVAVAVDQDSHKMHVRAMKHLSDAGIKKPSQDEYAEALVAVTAAA